MRTLRRLLIVLGGLAGAALGLVAWQVISLMRPERAPLKLHPTEFLVGSEDVEFAAADGLPLKGWLLGGRPGAPGIVLCHGLGGNRSFVFNLALPLSKSGYHVLLFDLRGHGESGGGRTTLGVREGLDVVGAVDFLLQQTGVDSRRLGGWGKDIGAYALVLAARERKQLRALALDSLYPDPGFLLGERLFPATGPLQAPLAWLAGMEFSLLLGPGSSGPPAGSALGSLSDRSLFLVVAREEERQAQATRTLLERIPEGKDTEKNLLELGASWSQNLYGEDRSRYEGNIRRFFLRVLPAEPQAGDDGPIRLLEG